MKKILFFIGSVLIVNTSKSQNVSYEVLEDNVQDIKRINIQINPFYADIYSGVNFATLGASASAEVSILKRIELKGEFRMAYLDGNSGKKQVSDLTGLNHPTCEGGTKRSNYFEAGAALYLFNWTRTRNLQVTLHSSSSGGRTYREYLNVPGERRRMFGLRSGLFMYNTGTRIGDNDFSNYTYLITNGADTMKNVGSPTANNVDGSDVTYVNTMVNSMVFYGGISLKSITNLIIRADGYGKKRHTGVYDIYADYLMCPYVSMKDVYTAGGKKWDVKHTSDGFKLSGWRVGVSYRSVNRFGFHYKFEFGSRPGLYFSDKADFLSGNYNCLLVMGCNIPFSKKKTK